MIKLPGGLKGKGPTRVMWRYQEGQAKAIARMSAGKTRVLTNYRLLDSSIAFGESKSVVRLCCMTGLRREGLKYF